MDRSDRTGTITVVSTNITKEGADVNGSAGSIAYDGTGRWDLEAWRARLLAAEAGVTLDEERLLFYDIRELMALQLRLRAALAGGGRWLPLRRPADPREHAAQAARRA